MPDRRKEWILLILLTSPPPLFSLNCALCKMSPANPLQEPNYIDFGNRRTVYSRHHSHCEEYEGAHCNATGENSCLIAVKSPIQGLGYWISMGCVHHEAQKHPSFYLQEKGLKFVWLCHTDMCNLPAPPTSGSSPSFPLTSIAPPPLPHPLLPFILFYSYLSRLILR